MRKITFFVAVKKNNSLLQKFSIFVELFAILDNIDHHLPSIVLW